MLKFQYQSLTYIGKGNMERLSKLLFELSSAERIKILLEFQKRNMKLSDISRKLDITVTETARHLQRLGDAKLIIKGTNGLYGLTPYGELVLAQFAGLSFVEKNRDTFLDYDTSSLPYEFVSRIGELAEGKLVTDPYTILEETARVFRDAQKFVWILSNKNLTLLAKVLAEKLNTHFDFKVILPETEFPPDSKAVIPSTAPGIQERALPSVELRVVVTEKEAGFSLPLRNRLSYRAFHGVDPKFHRWCKDLFLYYWDKAKPFTPKHA